ncbi:diaminopimelate decarboxylase [Kytococcus sedentarius]|uniref:Diaminopimelate decarboxylase n=1 Tax=Kytococcus sedentarius (strain ATCC 14392 / DSM 20547 / JCM 11482 / CCUG 33030 / NBRC 15357 / NCTC 11040 / CCM 314 / 541) TaxID=478801 RepID=C7NIU6_KYTSD|nr:diaminopimelate decarboxylase [Kytococcus sedentarius]ACV05171.1 diaminopimelate decarboxylase [Kytococcus sedentarius DSM 20547]QQB63639.1 diaminopimelate decarboxylase [Kytococcus sedentarius]STX13424.1 Diaminopimelate decarboxylase [Kytococcus sedentarius]
MTETTPTSPDAGSLAARIHPAKPLPTSAERMVELAAELPTPFHLYDEAAIRAHAREFNAAFAWAPGFLNHFAVKATPTPAIVRVLSEEGFGADCSSLPELELCDRLGIRGERIMFTSNDTPAEEFARAVELGAVANLDDITHLDTLEAAAGRLPELLSFRYNPGAERTGNAIIGDPVQAKYGVTSEQLLDAYREARDRGVQRFALHTMVASNELDGAYIVETARMVFELAVRLKDELGITLEFVNLGGGIGIPYGVDDAPMNLQAVSDGIRALHEQVLTPSGLEGLGLRFECGRVMTGPYGYLVSRVRQVTQKYKTYVGLDASMHNLMRPAMYGSYHHITVLPGPDAASLPDAGDLAPGATSTYDVTGSLCENNDKFAIDRELPVVHPGDVVVLHDAGAHGHSMGFNYNGKLRSAEYLLDQNGQAHQIRRAETMDDLFATVDWHA